MSKNLIKHLPELVEADVISAESAERIRVYYRQKESSGNRLIVVFGILGALLIGLGIILIIAHNWDQLSKGVKLAVAMLPLLISQILCAVALWRKAENVVWREASSVALMMSIAAAISIVSQVYNIEGDLASFLFTWMCLSIPIVYVMRSMMVSLLVIGGMTWYACEHSYFHYPDSIAWYYWIMLAVMIPFYFYGIKQPGKNFKILHAWFLAASVIITLGMFGRSDEAWLFVAYVSLFSAFILISEWMSRKEIPGAFAFLFSGSVGATVVLLILSFKLSWKELHPEYNGSIEMLVSMAVWFIAATLLLVMLRNDRQNGIHPLSFLFLVFIPVFVVGFASPVVGQVAANIIVLAIAVVTTKRGADQNNLVILNYGLAILTLLVLCRYFDTNLSFLVRGMLFIVVGACFFAANYYTLKKRKALQL